MIKRIVVHYTEESGLDGIDLIPFQIAFTFRSGKLEWDESLLYLPLYSSFEQLQDEDYFENRHSITIKPDELFIDKIKPDHFGIYMPLVVARLKKMTQDIQNEFDYEQDIEEFIVRISDLERLTQRNLKPLFSWEESL